MHDNYLAMILFEDALNIVLQTETHLQSEEVYFHDALGRILAEDVTSDINMPPFNKAAMDGFAIRESDIENELTIIETIAAGQTPQKKLEAGQASRIMTGAPVPDGADFVIQVELSEMVDDNTVRFTGHPKNNIIGKAEDVKTGDVVLRKGQQIDARQMAVLASVGWHRPKVYKQPMVGIISTGDEIIEPENKPTDAQIRNSNGHQLIAQVIESKAIANYFGIVDDSYESTYNAIKKGIETCDILLLTGGVSMGDFDFVPKIMADLGVDILFNRVAVQPGKPTTFGRRDNKVVFGLPGNPVSSFVQFDILVKPLIYKWMGYDYICPCVKLPVAADFKRKKDARQAYLPIKINESGKVVFTEYHGSAHIYALPASDGLAIIPKGTKELNQGDLVDVRLF